MQVCMYLGDSFFVVVLMLHFCDFPFISTVMLKQN